MNFIFQLQRFSRSRLSWALLLGLVIFFELCALYFQHVMLLAPCVMCVYERIAMLGIVGAAGIGLINPNALCCDGLVLPVGVTALIKA